MWYLFKLRVCLIFIYSTATRLGNMEFILYFIMPALVAGQITVEIKATGSEDSSTVKTNGYYLELINDQDRLAFGLTDESLQRAVEIIKGIKPEEVYVNNDIYLLNGWAQVTRKLEPTHSAITTTRSQTVSIEKEVSNNGSITDYFTVAIDADISDSVQSSWIEKYDSVGQPIGYEVVMGRNGEGSVGYASLWGESAEQSRRMKINPPEITLLLDAGEAVVAALFLTENVIAVDIEYSTTLAGSVAYKAGEVSDHIDVNDVITVLGLPLQQKSREHLMLTFYSDARLTVTEASTESVLLDTPVDIYPE